MVWASPLSIATTQGITIVLFSSAYLDVSVQRVCLSYNGITHSHVLGCPIRTSADQGIFAPPRSFSQLITSFFASESLGILRTPLLLLSLRWPSFVKRPLFPLALLLKLCFFHNVNELTIAGALLKWESNPLLVCRQAE